MRLIRKKLNIISSLMVILMFLMFVPFHTTFAAMISTEETDTSLKAQEHRESLKALLLRDDIKNAFSSMGVNPVEAKERFDSLTDSEVIELSENIHDLPAAGSAVGVIVGALLIVFLVLLFTDIMGYTDVFPFVKSQK